LKHKASEANEDKHAKRTTPFEDITTVMTKQTSNTLNT